MSTEVWLRWLASGAGGMAILSFLAERFPPFQRLSPKGKMMTFFIASVVVPMVARAILESFTPAELARLDPYLETLRTGLGVLLAYASGELVHAMDKRGRGA